MAGSHFWGGLVLVALALSPAARRDRTSELRAKFARETNPVHKAKAMQKLGAAEFKQIERNVADRRLEDAANILKQYHAEVEESLKALDQSGINAEKKPNGFKQLQFSVREALRRLDRLISTMTADQQPPFRRVRDRLEEINSHLLHELFPPERKKRRRHHFPL